MNGGYWNVVENKLLRERFLRVRRKIIQRRHAKDNRKQQLPAAKLDSGS